MKKMLPLRQGSYSFFKILTECEIVQIEVLIKFTLNDLTKFWGKPHPKFWFKNLFLKQ